MIGLSCEVLLKKSNQMIEWMSNKEVNEKKDSVIVNNKSEYGWNKRN